LNDAENIESKFRENFLDFEQDPPERVWEEVRKTIHPPSRPESFFTRIVNLPQSQPRLFRSYMAVAAASIVMFLTVVYFASGNKYTIRGHAYAGEVPLCRGTAVLFQVTDKAKPIDSLKHCSTVPVDENGFYRFSKVDHGKYLIHIVPDWNSEQDKLYHSSWNDQHIDPEQAHIIQIESEDQDVDVYLMPKKENPED